MSTSWIYLTHSSGSLFIKASTTPFEISIALEFLPLILSYFRIVEFPGKLLTIYS